MKADTVLKTQDVKPTALSLAIKWAPSGHVLSWHVQQNQMTCTHILALWLTDNINWI
jgi:hypothetical protein